MTAFAYQQRLELEGNVLHTYPQGDFDITSMNEHGEKIVAITAELERWVLYEHTAVNAGLTTSSMPHLFKMYQLFADNGCQGVAIGGESIFINIIPQHIPQQLALPIKVSKDDVALQAFLNTLI